MALKFYEEYPYNESQRAIDSAIDYFGTREPPVKLQAELIVLDETDVAAKVGAMGHYASQISTFWMDAAAMETAVRAVLIQTGNGQPAERLWRIIQ